MPCEFIHYLTHVRPQFTSPFSFLIRRLKSLPSRQIKSSPGWMMPHLAAMALAVLMLSPVTIRTVMPARWHLRMASGTWEEKRRTKWKVLKKCTLESHFGAHAVSTISITDLKHTRCAVWYLRSHRVLYPNHSDAGQLSHYFRLILPFRLWIGRQVTVCNADSPQPLACHRLNYLLISCTKSHCPTYYWLIHFIYF